jgi:signal peptidase I
MTSLDPLPGIRPLRRSRNPPRKGVRRFARDAAFFIALIGGSFAARSSLADHYYVPSGSMKPTVEIGDRIVVNKLAYGLRVPFTDTLALRGSTPSRGDVVVLESPVDGITLLKRVVALPGDLVEVRGGRVVIRGVVQPESHALGLERGGGPDFGPTVVPADRFLVLGDNRGDSMDGRFFGLVKRETILGKAAAVYVRDGKVGWHKL